MERAWLILDDDLKLMIVNYIGKKMTVVVDDVEMIDENHMSRRWAVARCHILLEKYSKLTEEELGMVVAGFVRKVLRNAFGCFEFLVDARVSLYGRDEIRIGIFFEVFE